MSEKIPNAVIGTVASVIADHYFNHTKLNSLFMEAGAPGNTPDGNCEQKCVNWFKRCNEDASINGLAVLGAVIEKYMMIPNSPPAPLFSGTQPSIITVGQDRIKNILAKNQLSYRNNGNIVLAGSNPITKTLEDYFKSGDFSSVEKEFERAVDNIGDDPHASITAACSIIEAGLKVYIEIFNLNAPSRLNVVPLWHVVQHHLPRNSDPTLAADQQKVLKGISSIIDGVGAFRSHIGSAHGRGQNPPSITIAEARLFVNAAHTTVVFVMDTLHA